MYRKRFEPQLSRLPENYCGWAAEHKEGERAEQETDSCTCNEPSSALPCQAEQSCRKDSASELSDIILIGAVIAFLLFMKGDGKPDASLLVPLAILLFTK
ncbi:MAG: hypothetical protein IJF74_03300 [Clostridia bacterium]|nr:hypothetical protein [Clostridia bacterium]